MTSVILAFGLSGCGSADVPPSRAETAQTPQTGGPAADPGPARVDLRARITAYAHSITKDEGYRGPTRAERRKVAAGVGHVLDGRMKRAEEDLSAVGYTVRTLKDRESGLKIAEIADAPSGDASARRGWGRVYVRLDEADARWSVQVPHPTADLHTEQLGIGVLLSDAPGGVLVIAGAHREAGHGNSADVAHREDTVFQAVCDELAERELPALQVHGFADDSLPGEDAIVSTGAGHEARRQARRLAEELDDRDLDVCRAWDGDCGDLEGRTNVQSEVADDEDAPFLHLEFSRTVRDDDELTQSVVAAMARIAEDWSEQDRT